MSRTALSTITSQGFDDALRPFGFDRMGRKLSWIKELNGFSVVVGAPVRHGRHDPQWGLYRAELVSVLWDDVEVGPPALHRCFVLARPGTVRHPAHVPSFSLGDLEVDEDLLGSVVDGLRHDLEAVVSWLDPFAGARDVWTYLAGWDGTTPFIVPANKGLAVFTAAALAVADGAPDAASLIEAARSLIGQRSSSHIWERRYQQLEKLQAGHT